MGSSGYSIFNNNHSAEQNVAEIEACCLSFSTASAMSNHLHKYPQLWHTCVSVIDEISVHSRVFVNLLFIHYLARNDPFKRSSIILMISEDSFVLYSIKRHSICSNDFSWESSVVNEQFVLHASNIG